VGQQVMMASLGIDDTWSGYPAARTRALAMFRDQPGANVVVLTGDIHSAWANDLTLEPGDGNPVAVEFVAPSVTSPGGLGFLGALNPEVRWADPGDDHGFFVLDITRERVQAAWYLLSGVASSSYRAATFRAAWSVLAGARSLRQDERAAGALRDWPALAP
jgi:alkaline phosphatase D